MGCGGNVGAISKTENRGEQVCKGGNKGSSVVTLGHMRMEKPMRDPRRDVSSWI